MLPFLEILGCFGACVFPFYLLVSALAVAFWVWMLVECVTKEPTEGNLQLIWVLLIVILPFLGSVLYFFVRRPDRIREHGG